MLCMLTSLSERVWICVCVCVHSSCFFVGFCFCFCWYILVRARFSGKLTFPCFQHSLHIGKVSDKYTFNHIQSFGTLSSNNNNNNNTVDVNAIVRFIDDLTRKDDIPYVTQLKCDAAPQYPILTLNNSVRLSLCLSLSSPLLSLVLILLLTRIVSIVC